MIAIIEVARVDNGWHIARCSAPVEVCRKQLARDIRRQRWASRNLRTWNDTEYLRELYVIGGALQAIRHNRPSTHRTWFGGRVFKV